MAPAEGASQPGDHLGIPRAVSVDTTGSDASKATFTLTHEDHTLGNAVRYILAKKYALSAQAMFALPARLPACAELWPARAPS